MKTTISGVCFLMVCSACYEIGISVIEKNLTPTMIKMFEMFDVD